MLIISLDGYLTIETFRYTSKASHWCLHPGIRDKNAREMNVSLFVSTNTCERQLFLLRWAGERTEPLPAPRLNNFSKVI